MSGKRIIIISSLLIVVISIPITLSIVKRQSNISSHAAAPDKLEAEGGVLGGNARPQSDSNASGGNYILLDSNLGCNLTPLVTSSATSDGGFAWIIEGNFGTTPDTSSNSTQSKLRAFENRVEIGPAHSAHSDIRSIGNGRFSHWSSPDNSGESIRFSTSDNSDPKSNNKTYSYCVGTGTGPTIQPTNNPTQSPPINAFYVSPAGSDSNPGTQISPWKTIQKAANTLKTGETGILLDGTYDEIGIEFKTNNGTKTSPITLKAQNKQKAILASRSGCNPSMSISSSYVTIDGLRFKMSTSNPSCPAPNSATVYIRCWESNEATPTNQASGTEGCTLRNVLMDSDPSRYEAFKTNQDFSLVEDSEIPDIATFKTKGVIFRRNVIRPTTSALAIIGKGGVRDFQAYNNIVYIDKNHEGILLGGNSCCTYDTSGYEAFNSVAYNNVVIETDGGSTDALTMYGAKDSGFFNNVVIGGYINFVNSGGDGNPQPPNSPTYENNIIDCRGHSATAGVATTGTRIIDYNLFQNCTNIPAQTHPITGDPKYVNPASDWHLSSGSPAIGSGITVIFTGYNGSIIDVSKIFDGSPRILPWNLGIW